MRWIEVMDRLTAENPGWLSPATRTSATPGLLADVHDCLRLLRDETRRRRDSAMAQETIVEEVRALMSARHPEWAGPAGSSGASAVCVPNTPPTPVRRRRGSPLAAGFARVSALSGGIPRTG